MIWVTDALNTAFYTDGEWEALTGQSPADATGAGWTKVIHPEDRLLVIKMVGDAKRSRAAFTLKYRVMNVDGGLSWVRDIGTPVIHPGDGEFLGYMGSVVVDDRASFEAADGKIIEPRSVAALIGVTPSAIERIADLVMEARAAAKDESEDAILQILDLALFQIGHRLAEESHADRKPNPPALNS